MCIRDRVNPGQSKRNLQLPKQRQGLPGYRKHLYWLILGPAVQTDSYSCGKTAESRTKFSITKHRHRDIATVAFEAGLNLTATMQWIWREEHSRFKILIRFCWRLSTYKSTGPRGSYYYRDNFTFSSEQGSGNFALAQKGDNLVFYLRTAEADGGETKTQIAPYRIDAGQPNHIVVAYRPGRLVCYVNGKRVFSTIDVVGNFSNWSAQRLLFGGQWGGERDWSGRLEGIAISNRFLSPEEAKHNYIHYAKRLKARQPVARFVVRASSERKRRCQRLPSCKNILAH